MCINTSIPCCPGQVLVLPVNEQNIYHIQVELIKNSKRSYMLIKTWNGEITKMFYQYNMHKKHKIWHVFVKDITTHSTPNKNQH